MLFRTTKQKPLAVSHWPLAKQQTPRQRHPDHTSFKKIKDVFDERRRITCFRISPRATAHPSPRTDAETKVNFVQFAHARHRSSKLGSALA